MNETRLKIDLNDPERFPRGRVDLDVLDATTEDDIARQEREDDIEAMRDMGRFARRVRRRLGLTQVEFAKRIDVSLETIRNWEQENGDPPVRPELCFVFLTRPPKPRCVCLAEAAGGSTRCWVRPVPTGNRSSLCVHFDWFGDGRILPQYPASLTAQG